jgi:hypothetical protein
MLRHVAYGCLVVSFVAFAYYGLIARARAPDAATPTATDDATQDEIPLEVGVLTQHALHKEIARGYPWPTLRESVPLYKRDLPPDLGKPSGDESRDNATITLSKMRFKMPTGPLSWPQIIDALRERFEPNGVKVLIGPAKLQPPEGLRMTLPDQEWTGIQIVSYMYQASQQMVGYQMCSEGVCVGTNGAVNYEMQTARLIEYRRRLAAEHAAPALDVDFRPDFVDAPMGSFDRVVQAQTGIEVVADPEIWDMGTVVRWRGEPRKLRDALDQLTVKLRAYWRYKDGRVWLLKP